MKHYNHDLDSHQSLADEVSVFNEPSRLPEFDQPRKIEKFPAEFKKNIYKSIDIRFLLILLFSVALNIGSIIILEKIVPSELTTKSINRIQEQYAKLLLNNTTQSTSYYAGATESDYNLDTQLMTGLNKWMDAFTNNILESIKDIPVYNTPDPAGVAKETRLPSREERGEARKTANIKRMASREELEKEVNSVGLLGLISSNARVIDQEYVQDLLEYAAENSTHLADVLSKLNSIEVPRYGNSGYLKKIRSSNSDAEDAVGLKGGRTTANNEVNDIIKHVEPIESVDTKPIKRNVEYEEVPSGSLDKLADLSLKGKVRSAQEVIRVVQSHTRALQDCYKQELRYDPTINGKILVRFVIEPDGGVKEASIISSTLNSPRMEECILNRIKRWRNFPPCDPEIGDKSYRQSFSFGEIK